VLLGTLLAAAAIVWLARELDLDREVLLDYLVGSAVLVAVPLVVAFLVVAVVKLIRRR
jgi:hypothetical protein